MSFSQDAKIEITKAYKKKKLKPCCVRAICCAAACFSKYFDNRGIVLQTETREVAEFVQKMFHREKIEGNILTKERPSGVIYEFSVKEKEDVARLMELLSVPNSEPSLHIQPELIVCPECIRGFVATAFLCSGTITDPAKTYQMEFLSSRFNLSRDFEALLAEHEFHPRRTVRKGVNIVYIKASDSIEDVLVFMGAKNAAMVIMNRKMYKEARNKTNRRNNCEMANMEKSVQAAVQVKKAVRYLQEHNMLEDLPQPLQDAARLRLERPDDSLSKLAESFDPSISKSGLSHRLKKLEQLAQEAQKRSENGTES